MCILYTCGRIPHFATSPPYHHHLHPPTHTHTHTSHTHILHTLASHTPHTTQVAGAPKITSMSVSKSGLQLLVNGADRGVRLLEIRNRPLTDALDGVRGGGQQARSVEEVRAMLLPLKVCCVCGLCHVGCLCAHIQYPIVWQHDTKIPHNTMTNTTLHHDNNNTTPQHTPHKHHKHNNSYPSRVV